MKPFYPKVPLLTRVFRSGHPAQPLSHGRQKPPLEAEEPGQVCGQKDEGAVPFFVGFPHNNEIILFGLLASTIGFPGADGRSAGAS